MLNQVKMLATAEMITFTEKLIDEIKHFPVLYDRKYMRCKDGGAEKEEAWILLTNRLPKDLNITVAETKKRWRTLKDCYSKHLRSGRSTNRFEARYRSWRWSRHMNYFRSHMLHGDGNEGDEITSPKSQKERCNDRRTNAFKKLVLNKRLRGEMEKDSKRHEHTERENDVDLTMEIVKAEKVMLHDVDDDPYQAITYAISDYEDIPASEPEATDVNVKTCNPKHTSSAENHNSIDPLVGGNFDALDLTFLGYASSIKKLSLRRQSLIKFTVAKLVMQQELAEQNEKVQTEHAPKTTKNRTEIEGF